MVPAVPTRGGDDGCGRMPAAVADDSLPLAAAAIVVEAVDVALVGRRAGILRRGKDVDGFGGVGAVEVPHVNLAVVRA